MVIRLEPYWILQNLASEQKHFIFRLHFYKWFPPPSKWAVLLTLSRYFWIRSMSWFFRPPIPSRLMPFYVRPRFETFYRRKKKMQSMPAVAFKFFPVLVCLVGVAFLRPGFRDPIWDNKAPGFIAVTPGRQNFHHIVYFGHWTIFRKLIRSNA